MTCPGCGRDFTNGKALGAHSHRRPECRPAVAAVTCLCGTISGYTHGCRCGGCKAAKARYMKEWRAARRRSRIQGGLAATICDILDTRGDATPAPVLAALLADRGRDVSRSTLGKTLARMRDAGLVESARDPDSGIDGPPRLLWRLAVDTDTWLAKVG